MYPYVDDDDDAEEDDDASVDFARQHTKTKNDFDDLSMVDLELDRKRRKRQILEEMQRREDEQFEGEWGYAIIKAIRGKTVGRRLRRKLFKYGLVELFCGFALTVIALMSAREFTDTAEFDSTKYGSTLIRLLGVISYPTLALGIATLIAVRHWATLTSNRKLLCNLMRIYVFCCFLLFVLVLWTVCAVFLTFSKKKDWSSSAKEAQMLPYYVCLCIFLLPYLAVLLLYTLDVSYLTDEVEKGGEIIERDPPPYARDLSDVSLFQSCIYVCGMPIIICIQLGDLCIAIRNAYEQSYRDAPGCCCKPADLFCLRKKTTPASEAVKKPKGKTIWHRMYRTVVRCIRGSKPKPTVLPMTQAGPTGLPLRELDKDREVMERNQREGLMQEADEERQRLALKEAADAAEFQLRLEEEARRLEAERLRKEQEEELRRQQEEFNQRWQAVLSVADYKSQWATLPTSGSFQCNLKSLPDLNHFTEHLKKQGFHIVFALSPSATDLEIGLCNIRPVGEESWFLARFLATKTSFSAVMKSDNPQIVPALVKRFALAKVLRIDGHGSKG